MNLVADERIDRPIVKRLRHDGHQVVYVAEMQPGTDDRIESLTGESCLHP